MNTRPAHVRLAMPQEAVAIATIQLDQWANDPLTAPFLDETALADITSAWETAILRPPMAHYRVLVAIRPDQIDLGQVVGFCSVGPSSDPDAAERDGQILEFMVSAAHRGQGHGSRLINAAADTLRADGYLMATWWLRSTDDDLRSWAEEFGWALDGAWRELTDDSERVKVKQTRLHTSLN